MAGSGLTTAGDGGSRTAPTMLKLRAAVNLMMMVALVVAFDKLFREFARNDSHLYWFLALFTWRYLRFAVNLVAFWCYFPAPKPRGRATYSPSTDVTAIIPTVDPEGAAFLECVRSCAGNRPAKIIIVTAGDELYIKTLALVRNLTKDFPLTTFVAERTQVASKRAQVALAVRHIETAITVLLDDHVFWGPRFLETMLYAFEDPRVGLVGTNKRVRREAGLGLWGRFWNMLGATYLCRHNFEIRASNAVDGGVFVISGRTCAIRTEILRHPEFLPGYTNERFFFGLFGPLNADDDNYNTRFCVRHGWRIKIQYTEDTVMETTLGVEKPLCTKFLGQCRRWARTTWRSNVCSLVTDRTVWATQPYCVYAVYLTSLTNFAAVVDPLLVHLLSRSSANSPRALAGLVCWILFTKLTKVFDYFRRHPQDLYLFPAYVAFAYFHSFIKLWTLLTFWDCTWSGRRLEQIKVNDRSHDDHPHVPTLRHIRTRIGELQGQQTQHIKSYQLPLLSELRHLRESFTALHRDQQLLCETQEAIRTELEAVTTKTEEVSAAQRATAASEANIAGAIAGVKIAVDEFEEKWKGYVADVAGKLAGSGGAATPAHAMSVAA